MNQKQAYMQAHWQDAVAACANTHIFPIVAIAESALESGWGQSWLTKEANNYFGVKSTPSWIASGGAVISKFTREVLHNVSVMVQADFRKYPTPLDSFKNYVHFVTQPLYVNKGVLSATTPEQQITEIAAAGYATDPKYAQLVISIIEGLKGLIPAP